MEKSQQREFLDKLDIFTKSGFRKGNCKSFLKKRNKNIWFVHISTLLKFYLTLKSQQNEKDEVYSDVIFKTVVDVCKFSKGTVANFAVKVVLDALKTGSNFSLECPFKKVMLKYCNECGFDFILI